ncbi:UNVERIFIED_CONTAM: ABC transporter C family member 10 [Sesamum radiatum]|uniref:ABC transporter C family member 10 n=1 Tax=Sesamum radiatum TaxID=300843 RepID=A0AAW2KD28_SESRA
MGSLWTLFCGETNCSDGQENGCGADLIFLTRPSSCNNHALIISFDVLLLVMFFFTIFSKTSFKSSHMAASSYKISSLQLVSAVYNGFLGFVYFALGVRILEEKWRRTQAFLPLHWWMLFILHGLIWLSLGLTVSLRGQQFSKAPLRLLSVLAFLSAGLSCGFSHFTAIVAKQMTVKIVLDVLWFVGSSLLILCTYKGFRYGGDDENDIYDPLLSTANGSSRTASVEMVTPFAKASCLSKFTFWWLNPLMKRGKEKTLEDEDIPKLREDDQAESCYLQYAEIYNRRKQSDPSAQPSILTTILLCHWKEIFISGFFALLKVITISAGPLLLKAFIKVAEGKERSPYEKYMLVLTLFLSKILESVSQRQWYFRCRLIGLKVRSLLTAVIYRKQLRLSNAAKLIHSSGEIMNYVTVDAYISAATFGTCYFLGVPLSSSNVFTFVATLRLVQDPVRIIPDVIGVFIQAKVAFARIVKFLEAPELETANVRVRKSETDDANLSVAFKSANLSWDENPLKPTLRDISLTVRKGDKIAICGEVGSGKSTLLGAILGEVPIAEGTVQVHGTIAYVSQSAWIQTGSIRDNILFSSAFDNERYQDTLERCSLVKDLELLPYGDLTEIGERGVNLSGGQKQRIQLARALYKDADIYLLDDPFSAVDAYHFKL